MNKLVLKIKEDIKEVKRHILERARIQKLTNKEKSKLFDINENVYDDWNDRENHMFDLGSYIALKGILRSVRKEDKNESVRKS